MADLGLAAAISGAQSLFTYNRDAFVFERTLNQARCYQQQNIRIEEAALFREDLRDLFDLTIKKMDSYLIINTLMLGFAVSIFGTAHLQDSVPHWLFWLYSLSLAGAILFLLLSVWFSLQASLTAQSFAVRLLTQWLRLPLPTNKDIKKATTTMTDYERAGYGKVLRLPVLNKTKYESSDNTGDSEINNLSDSEGAAIARRRSSVLVMGKELNDTRLLHFQVFSQIQHQWSGYDSYSRVFMVIGVNQLIQCLGIFGMQYFLLQSGHIWSTLVFIAVLNFCQYCHCTMNFNLSKSESIQMAILLYLCPITSFTATCLDPKIIPSAFGKPATVLCFVSHIFWLVFCLIQGYEKDGKLPIKFTMVNVSQDILGSGNMRTLIDTILAKLGKFPSSAVGTVDTMEDRCKQLQRKIQRIFNSWKSEGLNKETRDLLKQKFRRLQKKLIEIRCETEPGSPSSSIISRKISNTSLMSMGKNSQWVKMEVEEGNEKSYYYMNTQTGEIRLNKPDPSDDLLEFAQLTDGEKKLKDQIADFGKFVEEVKSKKAPSQLPRVSSSKSLVSDREDKFLVHYNVQGWRIYRMAAIMLFVVWCLGCIWIILDWSGLGTLEVKKVGSFDAIKKWKEIPSKLPKLYFPNKFRCKCETQIIQGIETRQPKFAFTDGQQPIFRDVSFIAGGKPVAGLLNYETSEDIEAGIVSRSSYHGLKVVLTSERVIVTGDKSYNLAATDAKDVGLNKDSLLVLVHDKVEIWDLETGDFQGILLPPGFDWMSVTGCDQEVFILGQNHETRKIVIKQLIHRS
jgi:hypothetical protein